MLRGVVLHPVVARRVCDDGEFRAGVADEDAVAGGQDGDVLATVGLRAFAVSRGSRRPAAGFPQEKGPSADGRLTFPEVLEPWPTDGGRDGSIERWLHQTGEPLAANLSVFIRVHPWLTKNPQS